MYSVYLEFVQMREEKSRKIGLVHVGLAELFPTVTWAKG